MGALKETWITTETLVRVRVCLNAYKLKSLDSRISERCWWRLTAEFFLLMGNRKLSATRRAICALSLSLSHAREHTIYQGHMGQLQTEFKHNDETNSWSRGRMANSQELISQGEMRLSLSLSLSQNEYQCEVFHRLQEPYSHIFAPVMGTPCICSLRCSHTGCADHFVINQVQLQD